MRTGTPSMLSAPDSRTFHGPMMDPVPQSGRLFKNRKSRVTAPSSKPSPLECAKNLAAAQEAHESFPGLRPAREAFPCEGESPFIFSIKFSCLFSVDKQPTSLKGINILIQTF